MDVTITRCKLKLYPCHGVHYGGLLELGLDGVAPLLPHFFVVSRILFAHLCTLFSLMVSFPVSFSPSVLSKTLQNTGRNSYILLSVLSSAHSPYFRALPSIPHLLYLTPLFIGGACLSYSFPPGR